MGHEEAMKKYLILFLLLASAVTIAAQSSVTPNTTISPNTSVTAAPSGGGPAYVFVNSSSCQLATAGGSCSYSPVAGHQVFVMGQVGSGTIAASTSLVDNATGGSTAYTADLNNTALRANNDFFIYRTCNVKSGVTSYTLANTSGGSAETTIIFLEFSGGNTSTCLDHISTGASGTGTTMSCCSLTPGVANELSLGLNFINANNPPITGSGGFTCVGQANTTFFDVTGGCYNILSGSPATLFTAGFNSSSSWWAFQGQYK
jgi:hypothetical protein